MIALCESGSSWPFCLSPDISDLASVGQSVVVTNKLYCCSK